MFPSINAIAYQQANPTQNTEAEITIFLYYSATNPTAVVQYKAIDMVLQIDIDAS